MKIDWWPVAESIKHLLNGTNPFATPVAIKALLKTDVSPRLTETLKHQGGMMLFNYLRANHTFERNLSHQLLVKLSGQDFGFDVVKWKNWIAEN